MEAKYYTPKVEEFHVGFEFESKIGNGLIHPSFYEEGQEWKQTVVQQGDFFTTIDPKSVRVKHLDREDIESLGWVRQTLNSENNYTYNGRSVKDVGSPIYLWFSGQNLHIQAVYSDQYTLFNGQVKNKSELKRLMVQLGITKE